MSRGFRAALLFAVPTAVMALWLLVAPLIVRLDYAALSPGDRVLHRLRGIGIVETIEGPRVMISRSDGKSFTVKVQDLTEL